MKKKREREEQKNNKNKKKMKKSESRSKVAGSQRKNNEAAFASFLCSGRSYLR